MDKVITENIKGFEIKLKTRPGVFSKDRIDPGSRFLLENIEIEEGALIADLGCGSGVIGFVAAKLNYTGHVHLLDVNLRIVELAKENAALNRLKNVEVFLSDLFSAVDKRSYHLILSNPAQHLGNLFLDEAAKACFEHLKPGGEAFWVIQKGPKRVVTELFEKYFSNCTIVAQSGDYVLVRGKRDGY